ncbi:MAG: hypothetical protein H6623_09025 [Bdellovibrionaceae bacterium]|nr:hypothetical protein [Pseudobdellovibrionaceae bacterium]
MTTTTTTYSTVLQFTIPTQHKDQLRSLARAAMSHLQNEGYSVEVSESDNKLNFVINTEDYTDANTGVTTRHIMPQEDIAIVENLVLQSLTMK